MSPETAASNLPIVHLQYDNGKNMDYWLSDTDNSETEEFEKMCPSTALSITSTKWTNLLTNLGLWNEKQFAESL